MNHTPITFRQALTYEVRSSRLMNWFLFLPTSIGVMLSDLLAAHFARKTMRRYRRYQMILAEFENVEQQLRDSLEDIKNGRLTDHDEVAKTL